MYKLSEKHIKVIKNNVKCCKTNHLSNKIDFREIAYIFLDSVPDKWYNIIEERSVIPMAETSANREYRDRLFKFIFGNPTTTRGAYEKGRFYVV